MKKMLCIVPALLLLVTIGVRDVHADSYAPTFTCQAAPPTDPLSGCPFHSIPTAPDVSFPAPTGIAVTVGGPVDGVVYDVSLAGADSPTDNYFYNFGVGGPNFGTGQPIWVGVLTIGDLTTGISDTVSEPVTIATDNLYGGTLSFSPASVTAPEPASLILLVLGIGLMPILRKTSHMRMRPRGAA